MRGYTSPPFDQVQATAVEAILGKLSCVSKGYYSDPHLLSFKPSLVAQPLMSPLINRGYFARVRGLEHIVQKFCASLTATGMMAANVLVLGAGLDTLCFRLMDKHVLTESIEFRFYEVDSSPIARYKAAAIARSRALLTLLDMKEDGAAALKHPSADQQSEVLLSSQDALTRGRYTLLAADLAQTDKLQAALKDAAFDSRVPTLIVIECVLVYMQPEESLRLVQCLSEACKESALVIYDMITPHDAFGRIMQQNLKSRGLLLPGLVSWPDLSAQLRRVVDEGGWEGAVAGDMNAVYAQLLQAQDRERANQIEQLDEVEEWQIMLGHYCFVVARQGQHTKDLFIDLPGFHSRKRSALGEAT